MKKTFVYVKDYQELYDKYLASEMKRGKLIQERDELKEELEKHKLRGKPFLNERAGEWIVKYFNAIDERDEARYWARKMMSERDKYKKMYEDERKFACLYCHAFYPRQSCAGCNNNK